MGAARELLVKIAFAFDGRGKQQADTAINSTKRNMNNMATQAGQAGSRLYRSFLQAVPGANVAIRAIQRIKASLSSVRGVNIKPNVSGLAGEMEGVGGKASSLIGKFKALGAAIAAAFVVRGAI